MGCLHKSTESLYHSPFTRPTRPHSGCHSHVMLHVEYPFDLGVGEVSSAGAKHNTLGLLRMSVPVTATADDKHAMHFWLSHGLVWYYAFNQEEAIKCFQRALDVSPKCIFAHWGISICHGPNYNTKAMSRDNFPSAKEAYFHASKVAELLGDPSILACLSEVEVAILSALSCRFNPVDDQTPADAPIDDNTNAYTEALQKVYLKFPSIACVACLYAESLMNFSPWKLWCLESGVAQPHAQKARQVLDKAIQRAPHHPGLNHFLVHLMEMSPFPQAALPSCDVLRFHFPDAGHLIHMPSHIYVLLGMYDQAAACNVEAITADEKYVLKEGIYNCYTGYRIHNIHFVSYAAMFAGQFDIAMDAAKQVKKNLPDDLMSNPFMAKYFEAFLSIEWHVLVRFGQWEEILSRPVPIDASNPPTDYVYPYTLAMQHYARGIAHAVLTGQKEDSSLIAAEKELALFRDAALIVPADRVMHNNLCSELIRVGDAMLQGEIKYRGKCFDDAFALLRQAVEISDSLVYDEPWGWMQPPRHALGALLLEQGHIQEAEMHFRKDMDTAFIGRCHPNNLWALSGLAKCLETHPEEYIDSDSKQNTNEVEVTQSSPLRSFEESTQDGSSSASLLEQSGPRSSSVWKQVNLKLDWAHIGPDVTTPSCVKPCRKQELIDSNRKISEIKAIARRSSSSDASMPWLADDTTVAACLCAKSIKKPSGDEIGDRCCKRQRL